jgi:hypothetical protein
MPRNTSPVSSDEQSVPRNATEAHTEAGGKKRSERLRARRDEAGLTQVSGWVPKDRRAFAREVLAALSRGSNSLPPDPGQAAALEVAQNALEAAQAEAVAAREMLEVAQQHEHSLTDELGAIHVKLNAAQAELDVARAEVQVALDAKRQAETAALVQVETAKAEAALAQATAERFQKASGLRGRAIRWLAR